MLCVTISFLAIERQVKDADVGDQIENALMNAEGRASNQEMLLGKPFQHWRILSIHSILIWSTAKFIFKRNFDSNLAKNLQWGTLIVFDFATILKWLASRLVFVFCLG